MPEGVADTRGTKQTLMWDMQAMLASMETLRVDMPGEKDEVLTAYKFVNEKANTPGQLQGMDPAFPLPSAAATGLMLSYYKKLNPFNPEPTNTAELAP